MSSFSQKELSFNHPPADGIASQSTQQPLPVCTWSAHVPQSGPSKSPFPRWDHALTTTATATGELFLFGGQTHHGRSSDLFVLSTQDLSTTLMHTSGEGPSPRSAHRAALIGTNLLICGGLFGRILDINEDSLYLLNLELREWTRLVVYGHGPSYLYYHTTTVVGSKVYVFGLGSSIGGSYTNDMWTLDLNCLTSQLVWELVETPPGNEKPPGRNAHVSVTTENRIIISGGVGSNEQYYNDTWSFDILTRKWTELHCTGSAPSPRKFHAAVLVDDAMYVFGGSSRSEASLDDLYSLQLSTQRWFKFHNVGPSPQSRRAHAMASVGTRVFLLGGYSNADDTSLIHVFDTKDIKYPEPERNAANPNERATQRIAQLTDEIALENALLEQAEANAVEAARRVDDRQLLMTSLVKQRDAELVDVQTSLKDMQASLRDMQAKLDELLLSRDQQIGQYEMELANVHAKLEANESELEAVRLRLADAEKGLTESKADADALRAQTASGSVNRDGDQVTMERVRAIVAEMVSKRWNEKRIVDMECQNED